MVLEVMEALGVGPSFVLGTSQGGFIAARMALLQPEKVSLVPVVGRAGLMLAKVLGLVLCGTSLYAETSAHGSWDINEVRLILLVAQSTERLTQLAATDLQARSPHPRVDRAYARLCPPSALYGRCHPFRIWNCRFGSPEAADPQAARASVRRRRGEAAVPHDHQVRFFSLPDHAS